MEFLWGCMMLILQVALGSLCWSLVIAIPVIVCAAWISILKY